MSPSYIALCSAIAAQAVAELSSTNLSELYDQQLLQDLQDRVRSDPDYLAEPHRFPNITSRIASRFVKHSASLHFVFVTWCFIMIWFFMHDRPSSASAAPATARAAVAPSADPQELDPDNMD